MSCIKCKHFTCEAVGDYDWQGYDNRCEKDPRLGNLRSFPFKTRRPCFQVDFWHSKYSDFSANVVNEDTDPDAVEKAYSAALAAYASDPDPQEAAE